MLNKKQKIAADIYIETGNRELALEKAGYNKNQHIFLIMIKCRNI